MLSCKQCLDSGDVAAARRSNQPLGSSLCRSDLTSVGTCRQGQRAADDLAVLIHPPHLVMPIPERGGRQFGFVTGSHSSGPITVSPHAVSWQQRRSEALAGRQSRGTSSWTFAAPQPPLSVSPDRCVGSVRCGGDPCGAEAKALELSGSSGISSRRQLPDSGVPLSALRADQCHLPST